MYLTGSHIAIAKMLHSACHKRPTAIRILTDTLPCDTTKVSPVKVSQEDLYCCYDVVRDGLLRHRGCHFYEQHIQLSWLLLSDLQ